MDALALFTLQFKNQNKELYEILRQQIQPQKENEKLNTGEKE